MSRPVVVVSVGTDHHPFDRLIEWVERWAARSEDPIRLVVQHGASRPALGAENHETLSVDDIRALYATADVVVAQVGPGTIADVNAVGRRPVVVPRDPALGEVIDGHQVVYGRLMHRSGRALMVETEPALQVAVDAALSDASTARLEPTTMGDGASSAVADIMRGNGARRHGIGPAMRRLREMLARPA